MTPHGLRPLSWLLALPFAAGALTVFAQNSGMPLRAVGEFSNLRSTGEHAYGYAVQLWRDGDSTLGLLLVSEGLQGDTPTGLLENLRWNPRTGALSFTAKLSIGVAVLPGGRQEPSRDLFEFSGALKGAMLTGTILRSDPLLPSRPPSRERVQLRLQPGPVLFAAESYEAWKRQADELLKRRGPRW